MVLAPSSLVSTASERSCIWRCMSSSSACRRRRRAWQKGYMCPRASDERTSATTCSLPSPSTLEGWTCPACS
eukprot:3832478-Pyramimonas_sp.AAC.1